MTAIVGVLNSRGVAIAADSAVTVIGNNIKKVYNRSNKIFTLSKFHPVGISIYNSADFMGIPLETIIKLYRHKIKDRPFDTLVEYKNDFLVFLQNQIINVSTEMKRDMFYRFCSNTYETLIDNIESSLDTQHEAILGSTPEQIFQIFSTVADESIDQYLADMRAQKQANYINIDINAFTTAYHPYIDEILRYIQEQLNINYQGFELNAGHRQKIADLLFSLVNIELIFETYCGLVFFGFGDKEIYPSTEQVLVGTVITDVARIREMEKVKIIPGIMDSNIIPFAQVDVTHTVLRGVDPNYKREVEKSLKSSFDTISSEIAAIIGNAQQAQAIDVLMKRISSEFINKLDRYQFDVITRPLLEILNHMGKEDMSELAESLVSITSLKRKFTSNDSADESVGGPVDVAIVTKGDGFIWMKRKHYFDNNNNQGFMANYYKI